MEDKSRDTSNSSSERVARERAFHNELFAADNLRPQGDFYTALQNCFQLYRQLVDEKSAGARVLEYGCARGDRALELAPTARHIAGIDISEVAINLAAKRAKDLSCDNTDFGVMDAENLTFPDNSFEFVFGSGIIHHLNIERAFSEISRVIQPGGEAIFVEPLGHNPLINWYRKKTPEARTPDEHPLRKQDIELAGNFFSKVNLTFYGLTTIGSSFINNTTAKDILYQTFRPIDRILLSLPVIKWHAWYVLIRLAR
ncbi:MAG: class I SAM-dependent methyltransferase [Halieaceae bacterium]|jgi:ubiquinone/menaquinone biosynthesis C-methylase UbiE|nr:class I SAM-dependent methyltransferase [Halieaceae bacterium]